MAELCDGESTGAMNRAPTAALREIPPPPDDDLRQLAPADLRRVTAWVEDRIGNEIVALAGRIERELPGTLRADPTLQLAQRVCRRLRAAVEEVQKLAAGSRQGTGGAGSRRAAETRADHSGSGSS